MKNGFTQLLIIEKKNNLILYNWNYLLKEFLEKNGFQNNSRQQKRW